MCGTEHLNSVVFISYRSPTCFSCYFLFLVFFNCPVYRFVQMYLIVKYYSIWWLFFPHCMCVYTIRVLSAYCIVVVTVTIDYIVVSRPWIFAIDRYPEGLSDDKLRLKNVCTLLRYPRVSIMVVKTEQWKCSVSAEVSAEDALPGRLDIHQKHPMGTVGGWLIFEFSC